MTILHAALAVLATLLVAGCTVTAQETRLDPRDGIIHRVLQDYFWGRARDIDGQPIQPASERERTTVPVPMPIAYGALEAGEVSGTAEWCGLEWEPHYFLLTQSARSQEMSDTQVAFISVLHGFAQGAFIRSVEGTTCDELTRGEAAARLKSSAELGHQP